jgi:phosphate/sulfate permease
LLTVFAFVFGWNNSGLTAGNLSNFINYNLALFLTIAGILAGAALLGPTMSSSIIGKLVSTSLPPAALVSGILVSVITLLALTLLRLPVSLSNCVVGAFAGATLAASTPIRLSFLVVILLSWITAPFATAVIARIIYFLSIRIIGQSSLVSVLEANRLFLLVVVFLVSFTLGANNIGLILSFARNESQFSFELIEGTILVAVSLGTILFGKKLSGVISEKIVGLSQLKTLCAMLATSIITALLTSLSIPVSLTQVIIGGMVGAGISQRPSMINRRELVTLVSGWALITIVSAGLGYLVSKYLITLNVF